MGFNVCLNSGSFPLHDCEINRRLGTEFTSNMRGSGGTGETGFPCLRPTKIRQFRWSFT